METKTPIFKRVPPGDRWIELDGNPDRIFASLTDTLEHYFQKTKTRQYYIDAAAGTIFKVTEEADPEPIIQRFSIYDDGF
jgi:rRNA pseudouridine-1189 N-methylase Emg1 (Nep1/Mra1 family)